MKRAWGGKIAAALFLSLGLSCCKSATSASDDLALEPTMDGQTQTGTIEGFDVQSLCCILAAPHGSFDRFTDQIVARVAPAVHWNSVIVHGFRLAEAPINVNRPTEGVDLGASGETVTDRAKLVYDQYLAKVKSLFPKDHALAYYVEIHGNKHPDLAHKIEVAGNGLSPAARVQIKALFLAKMAEAGLGDIDVAMEGIDQLHFVASGVKQYGVFKELPTAFQIEMPAELRGPRQDQVVDFLTKALPELPNSGHPT